MRRPDGALLDLYRAARELERDDFRAVSLKLVRRHVDDEAGVWGRGRLAPDDAAITPARVRVGSSNSSPGAWVHRNG